MATLLDIRTQLIRESGRNDLVGESGGAPDYETDNGANWFINQGQRLLDNLLPDPINKKCLTVTLTAGEHSVAVPGLRAPLEVWASNPSERWTLVRQTQQRLRNFFPVPFSNIDPGTPCWWAMGYAAQADVPHAAPSLSILPPTDEDVSLTVLGTYYSDEMSSNTDTSWWSVNHEGLLVLAALHELEVAMRNTAGANDWMTQIALHIQKIDHDLADAEAVDKTEFEG